MKTVTIEQFMDFEPCWNKEDITSVVGGKTTWTAIDVLNLDDVLVSPEDKLWVVLREEFIDAEILHEFACRYAERALANVEKPDPRSTAAVEAKRKWLKGEIDDDELEAALTASKAASRYSAWVADEAAARSSAMDASDSARDAVRDVSDAAWAAWFAAWTASRAAVRDARSAARNTAKTDSRASERVAAQKWQREELVMMLTIQQREELE